MKYKALLLSLAGVFVASTASAQIAILGGNSHVDSIAENTVNFGWPDSDVASPTGGVVNEVNPMFDDIAANGAREIVEGYAGHASDAAGNQIAMASLLFGYVDVGYGLVGEGYADGYDFSYVNFDLTMASNVSIDFFLDSISSVTDYSGSSTVQQGVSLFYGVWDYSTNSYIATQFMGSVGGSLSGTDNLLLGVGSYALVTEGLVQSYGLGDVTVYTDGYTELTLTATAVPEPATMLAFAGGLAVLARRRRK